MADQAGDEVADGDGRERGDQGKERREECAEGDPQDRQRQHDAKHGASRFTLPLGVLDVLPAERDLQAASPASWATFMTFATEAIGRSTDRLSKVTVAKATVPFRLI